MCTEIFLDRKMIGETPFIYRPMYTYLYIHIYLYIHTYLYENCAK